MGFAKYRKKKREKIFSTYLNINHTLVEFELIRVFIAFLHLFSPPKKLKCSVKCVGGREGREKSLSHSCEVHILWGGVSIHTPFSMESYLLLCVFGQIPNKLFSIIY